MWNVILSPVVNAVRSWMANQTYKAAQEGGRLGLERFAADFGRQFTLPGPAPEAIPMPSAEQVTEALDARLIDRAKELLGQGLSQREVARQLDVPESTLRGWLKRES